MTLKYTCVDCGYEYFADTTTCPLCAGRWQGWELLFAPLKLDDLRAQVMGWLGQLPSPAVIEWIASPMGLRVRLYLPPHVAEGVVQAWAAMTGQHSRWRSWRSGCASGSRCFPQSVPLLASARTAILYASN
ncbi:MAG: hypothetical protein LC130_25300 [Bryobacterales bacterium]|nr:hypothetical protein [Bryobacterales bacterium]